MRVIDFGRANPYTKEFRNQLRPLTDVITKADRIKSILVQGACYFGIDRASEIAAYLIAPQAYVAAITYGIAAGVLYGCLNQMMASHQSNAYSEGFFEGICHRNITREWSDYLQKNAVLNQRGYLREITRTMAFRFGLAGLITLAPKFSRALCVPQLAGFAMGTDIGYNLSRLALEIILKAAEACCPRQQRNPA